MSVYALYNILFLRHWVDKLFLRKTAVLMTLSHKKEFMSLFLNIVLVSSQIVWLTCSKTSFFSEKYVTVSSQIMFSELNQVLRLRYLCL